jgi:hypothetical protein
MGLYEKLAEIYQETHGLAKDLEVAYEGSATNYKGVSEKIVLKTLRPLFVKKKIIILPQPPTQLVTNGKILTGSFSFKIIDTETGESEVVGSPGTGHDGADKKAGKAFTYAFKIMLIKAFMLISGEDTDNTHSDEIIDYDSKEDAAMARLHKLLDDYMVMGGLTEEAYDAAKAKTFSSLEAIQEAIVSLEAKMNR